MYEGPGICAFPLHFLTFLKILNNLLDFLAVGDAVLGANCIKAPEALQGGCASSRLDHGLQNRQQSFKL